MTDRAPKWLPPPAVLGGAFRGQQWGQAGRSSILNADTFKAHGMFRGNPNWDAANRRQVALAARPGDVRSEFNRDYNRVLHCSAYRRLKHKTQVFFAPSNDHVCTRIEHVTHVAAISHNIACHLGLNQDLTNAIALAHDLGHAPFGHAGESYLKGIVEKELGGTFWHERNGLRVVDLIETLDDPDGNPQKLNLTYAVRDGIVCHCGEVNEMGIIPRQEAIDLNAIKTLNQCPPFTWEGAVVKVSDKIAYLGRDIEDAISLHLLQKAQLRELRDIIKDHGLSSIRTANSSALIHGFVTDLCANSAPETGICLSENVRGLMTRLKDFNYHHIYAHERIERYKRFARLVVETIYEVLAQCHQPDRGILVARIDRQAGVYPLLCGKFRDWLRKYSDLGQNRSGGSPVYRLSDLKDFKMAVVDFMSGMTDNFAIACYEELTTFR